ncbi:MAG TPA: hypothetical protein VE712_02225 [Actinomycetota bacterium]|nr:hypothetical protein [Actinomycetota bacterium]
MDVGRLRGAILVALAFVGPACASGSDEPERRQEPSAFETPFGDDEVYPVFASSEVTVGRNRFLVGLLNDEDAPIGSPRIDMHIEFFDLNRSSSDSVTDTEMRWIWMDKPFTGLYASEVSFDEPGRWGAEVTVSGEGVDATVRSSFEVRREGSTPAVGERAPSSDTPTATQPGAIRRISTDAHPDPRFYTTSIADALGAGEPFVVVFATPKFCASQACGPVLDNVKRVARHERGLTFIHVEPYELPADPTDLEPVSAAIEWRLPSEPWVFVLDGRGRVAAKFEGALSPEELRSALRRL